MEHFGDLQTSIYRSGHDGVPPRLPITPDELERAARDAMDERAVAYVFGGAGTERTVRANVAAFHRWRLDPRMLRGVVERDLSTELFGRTLAAPVLTAPIGALGLVHPAPEIAVAAATAALGIGAVITTMSQVPMEDVAAAVPDGTRWYQLYWAADDEVAESMVRRAEAAGFGAIVLTVDAWTLGWRPRDLALGHLPFHTATGIANHLSDPVFRSRLAEPPEASDEARRTAVAAATAMFGKPTLTWRDLGRLREWTSLPILVKGICNPDDARAAVDAGADGVVVSNHGGRQVDGARAAVDCLVDVAAAVGDRTTLVFDSGIRCAADVLVALALGADAVLVGRPWIYGLVLDGQDGVEHVLRHLLAEVDLTMALCGYATPAELTPRSVVREG